MTFALEAKRLNKYFGGLHVIRDLDLSLEPGARHALIGPNGAGKTTFINLLTGALKPDSGAILLRGVEIGGLSPAARTKHGLARSFQITSLFPALSTADNVALAVSERRKEGSRLFPMTGFSHPTIQEVAERLDFLGLSHYADIRVRDLAYGVQRVVEFAVALALSPTVLLLDEPAAGVPSSDYEMILEALDRLPPDVAVLLIEHDMDLVFRFAQQITVMVQGEILLTGNPDAIKDDPRVKAVYLGNRG
jgi:branched-chain amino acid transport system ATP-binding protein